jgi:hypothetical protein
VVCGSCGADAPGLCAAPSWHHVYEICTGESRGPPDAVTNSSRDSPPQASTRPWAAAGKGNPTLPGKRRPSCVTAIVARSMRESRDRGEHNNAATLEKKKTHQPAHWHMNMNRYDMREINDLRPTSRPHGRSRGRGCEAPAYPTGPTAGRACSSCRHKSRWSAEGGARQHLPISSPWRRCNTTVRRAVPSLCDRSAEDELR